MLGQMLLAFSLASFIDISPIVLFSNSPFTRRWRKKDLDFARARRYKPCTPSTCHVPLASGTSSSDFWLALRDFLAGDAGFPDGCPEGSDSIRFRSEEHTSELQS